MPASDYVKLEQRLVLADWACHKLGYESNKAMLQSLRDVDEGFDGKGNSYLVQAIAARGSKCKVAREDLDRYDANIRAHLNYFNKHRKERLTLRYFQHLSLIIAEFFLYRRFNHQAALRMGEEKKGAGVSVPVEAFEGNNLIFVDEGHKGASSEAGKWIGNRDKLAENGFTFEYSATFVQAMTAAKRVGLTAA